MITISKFSNTIEYSLKTTLDSSGITKLQSELRNVQNELRRMQNLELIPKGQSQEALRQINTIEKALSKAFNPSLGMLDNRKFASILSSNNISIQSMAKSFDTVGTKGQIAFNNVLGRLGQVDVGLKSISKTTDKVFNTIGNTVRWGVVASGFQGVMNSMHESVEYVKELDRSLTDIMMVTDYSRQQMNEYAKSANEAAKAIGSTTVAMTDATLVFAQQGFDLPEASALAERSTKLANASQQQTAVTSDQITAMMNAYGIEDDIAAIDQSLDAWANVANVSAADVKEIAIGFQKAGSTANTVGVSMDQLNAQIAAIESVTREAPENIGNGLKTLYARFADIGMGETLEDGVNLGQVTQTLNDVGVQVLDAEGKMNDVGDIMEELMDVWGTLDKTQKNAIATTLAGKYQLSRFEALMNRSDLYDEYKDASKDAEGTLDTMNDKYVDSLKGKMNSLQASFEGVLGSLLETDNFYGVIEGLTTTIDLFGDLIDSIGGGGQALLAFGSIATRVFSKNMAAGIANTVSNFKMNKQRQDNTIYNNRLLKDMGASDAVLDKENASSKKLLNFVNKTNQFDEVLTTEQLEAKNELLKNMVRSQNELVDAESALQAKVEATNIAYRARGGEGELITKNKDGSYNFADLEREEKDLGGEAVASKKWLQQNEVLARVDSSLEELQRSAVRFEEIQKEVSNSGTADWGKYEQALNKVEREIDFLSKDSGILGKHFQKIRELYLQFQEAVESGKPSKEINELSQAYRNATQEALKLVQAVREGNVGDSKSFRKDQENVESAKAIADYDEKAGDDFINKGDSQQRVKTILDTAGAVSQLAFSLESLHSLGSIWENEDLTTGEKIQQTVLNLAMTLPMFVSGMSELNQKQQESAKVQKLQTVASKKSELALKQQESARKNLQAAEIVEAKAKNASAAGDTRVARQSAIAAQKLREQAAAANLSAIAAQTAARGASVLSKALTVLGGPLGIAMIALGAITTLYGGYEEKINQVKEAEQEKAQASREASSALTEDFDAWSKMNAEFEKTSKASDEYKEASIALAEQLGIENTQIYKNIDAYKGLSTAIKNARETQLQTTIDENQAYIQGTSGKETSEGTWNKKSAVDAYNSEVTAFANTETQGSKVNAQAKQLIKSSLNSAGQVETVLDSWNSAKTVIEDIGRELEAVEAGTSAAIQDMTEGERKQYKELLEAQSKKFEEHSNREDIFEYREASKAIAESEALLESNQKLFNEAKSVDEIFQTMSSNELIGDWFNNLTSESEKLAFAMATVKDETQQLMLVRRQSEVDFEDSLVEKTRGMTDAFGVTISEQQARAAASSAIKQINESGLSEEDKLQAVMTINQMDSFAQMQEFIEYVNQEGKLPKVQVNVEVTSDGFMKSIIDDSEAMNALYQSAGINEEIFNTYTEIQDQQSKADEEFVAAQETRLKTLTTNVEAIKAERDAKAQDLKEIQQAASAMDTFSSHMTPESTSLKGFKDSESYNKTLKETEEELEELSNSYRDVTLKAGRAAKAAESMERNNKEFAASCIEAANGMDDLSENIDSYSKIIKEADKGSLEYAEAMTKVRDDLGGILNMDPSSFSTDFIEENLDQIQQAAGGSEEAINQLRASAYDDVVMNLDLSGLTSEDAQYVKDTLAGIKDEALAVTQALPAGTAIDIETDQAMKSLNELAAQGLLTAEDMKQISASLGYEAEVSMVPGPPAVSRSTGVFYLGGDGNYGTPSIPVSWSSEMEVETQVPQITTAESSGSGNSMAKMGTSSKSPRSKGATPKKSSSGGSGKKAEYKPKTKDRIEEDIDRYQKVNAELSDIENTLNRINKEQDRTTGFDLGDNMDKQIGLLEKQIALTKEKYKIQQKEAEELRSNLDSQFGVEFDGDGMISNYRQTLKQLEGEVNSLIDKYNNTSTEEGQEKLEEQIEKATERLNDFKEMYKRYDTLWSEELRQSKEALEDSEDQIEDLRIEAFKTAVEVVDNIKDMNEAMIEFEASIRKIKNLTDDDPFGQMADSSKKLSYYFDDANGSADNFFNTMKERTKEREKEADKDLAAAKKRKKNAKTNEEKRMADEDIKDAKEKKANAQLANKFYSQTAAKAQFGKTGSGYLDMATYNREMIMEQIRQYEKTGTSEIFGKNSKALYETAKEILEQSQDIINDFADDLLELQQSILDSMDKMQEKADALHADYENLGDSLEHLYDITEKVQGDQSYDMLNAVLDKQIANNQQYKKSLEEELKIWQQIEASSKVGSATWQNAHEKIAETQKNINTLVSDTFDMAQKKYENTINKITSAWANGMMNLGKFGNGSQLGSALDNALRDENGNALLKDIDWMATEWELINRNADYYLDEVNKSYNIQKLQNKYVDLLNQAQGAGLGIQSKISAQMRQQLEYLRDKKNLSEYDVAYAEAQLEILQKQIALEETRNNKNEMRLRRDSQGNYRYQYVANEADTKGAENDLLDAQNNAYNLSKDQMKQTQADSLSALQDAKNTIDNIWMNANDSLATKKAKTQQVLDSLKEYIAGTSEQLNTSETNIINDFIAMTELLTEENRTGLEDIYQQVMDGNVAAFDAIDTRWSTSLTDWLYNMDIFEASMDDMYASLVQSGEDFAVTTEDITGQIKDDWDNVTNTLNQATDAMSTLAQRNADFIAQMRNDAKVVEDYNSTLMQYQARIDSANTSLSKYQEEVKRLNKIIKQKEAENLALTSTVSQNGGSGGSKGSGSGSDSGGGKNKPRAGDYITYKGKYYNSSDGGTPVGNWYSGQTKAVKISSFSGSPYGNGKTYGPWKVHIEDKHGGHLGWIKPNQIIGYRTGGYTGNWSDGNSQADNGKLAYLHQKELVLNEHDTENMLKIIQAVRAITTDLKAGIMEGLSSNFNAGIAYTQSPQDIQQQVQIDANFPNVTSSNEIENAILGLIDQTPQYVMRTR